MILPRRRSVSTLPADIAAKIEPALVERGCSVYSNASVHRMLPEVPLIVPEVNGIVLERIDGPQVFYVLD